MGKASFEIFLETKQKFLAPLMEFNCLNATEPLRRSWYSFHQPRKDERLSRPWRHPVVLNSGSLEI